MKRNVVRTDSIRLKQIQSYVSIIVKRFTFIFTRKKTVFLECSGKMFENGEKTLDGRNEF